MGAAKMQFAVTGGAAPATSRAPAEWPSFHGSAVPETTDPFSVSQDFVRALHHRVCQPLTVLCCTLEILESAGGVSQRTTEQVQSAMVQANRAMEMMSQFRQLFEAEFPVEGASTALNPLLEEVVEDLRLLAAMHGSRMAVEAEAPRPEVRMCARPLRQALWNVLQNCLDLTLKGGSVNVRVARKAETATLTVVDGSVTSAGEVERIFDPFSYCENRAEKSRVSNLPLAVAQRILHAAGGGLEVSQPHGIANRVFEVRLPIDRG